MRARHIHRRIINGFGITAEFGHPNFVFISHRRLVCVCACTRPTESMRNDSSDATFISLRRDVNAASEWALEPMRTGTQTEKMFTKLKVKWEKMKTIGIRMNDIQTLCRTCPNVFFSGHPWLWGSTRKSKNKNKVEINYICCGDGFLVSVRPRHEWIVAYFSIFLSLPRRSPKHSRRHPCSTWLDAKCDFGGLWHWLRECQMLGATH